MPPPTGAAERRQVEAHVGRRLWERKLLTISSVGPQFPTFMKCIEAQVIGLRAKFLWWKLVLYNKDGLACLDERKELMTLLVGETFFVENPIKIGK